jgi:hypothetical protein
MKGKSVYIFIFSVALITLSSCIKEIDTTPIPRTVEETFTVQNSIKQVQSYFKFYENTVLEVSTASPFSWDLAFESAGSGNRVLIGWGTKSRAINSGKFDIADLSQAEILDLIDNPDIWKFNDPTYINVADSIYLRNWENGEVYIHDRGRESNTYYVFQFVSRNETSYTIKYASAQSLNNISEATIYRSSGYNYVSFSYEENSVVEVEPLYTDWDILFTPYTGWWETDEPGIYAPFFVSGIMINNEYGVRVAHVFDPAIEFSDIDLSYIDDYEFTDMKGAIGADWKILGAVGSPNLYTMDPDKKYLLKKYDPEGDRDMYFKLQIVDYKLDGEDHHPTVEFKFLGSM